MPVRREVVGSGLTRTESFVIEGELTRAEEAEAVALEAIHTVEGRLNAVERACADVLRTVGLPSSAGNYNCNLSGEWEVAHELRSGWTHTRSVWMIAKLRGFAADSRVGFAARMLEDICLVRERRAAGSEEGALMMMFYLGVKWSASGIKKRHASNSRPIEPARTRERDKAMAQEFQARRAKARMSDTALMAEIGLKQTPPLKRSSAIEAIKRGRQLLSG
jgi:hypothetical protein